MNERVPGAGQVVGPGAGQVAGNEVVEPPAPLRPGRVSGWLLGFLLLSVILGAGVGVLWEQLVPLPSYTVGSSGVATTTERGLAAMFSGDAWFCALGFLVCLGLGLVAWRWFHPLGWPTVLIAVIGALIAALVCWWVGFHLGPSSFTDRMAAAKPGDVVSVQLTLRTKASLVIWAFAVVIPILLRASLGRDEEDQASQDGGPKRPLARSEQS